MKLTAYCTSEECCKYLKGYERKDLNVNKKAKSKLLPLVPRILSLREEGLKHREIAKIIGVKTNTISSILTRIEKGAEVVPDFKEIPVYGYKESVVREVSKHETFCPECKSALFWIRGEESLQNNP